jgi:hypothetical protein
MNESPGFDTQVAHRHFAATCFNAAWDLIDKPERTASESIAMLLRSAASAWHWTERGDCTSRNLSIAYWQLSRVFALLNEPGLARKFGELCLQASEGDEPFYTAYAHEALARAAAVAGNADACQRHRNEASRLAERVTDAESRKALLADLQTVHG